MSLPSAPAGFRCSAPWPCLSVAFALCHAIGIAAEIDRIAILGCHRQDEPAPAIAACRRAEPDLVLWIGDNVYADTEDSPEHIRQCYAKLAAQPGFAELRAAAPWLATWDDHDFGLNDAGKDYRFKHESRDIFREFWRLTSEIPAARDGVYYAKTFATQGRTLQLILLDPRFNRDDPGPAADTLGPRQWAWLAERLAEPADLRLVVSGYQILLDADTGSETWAEFPRARERLFRLIREQGAERVVFLTGDQHYGEACRLRAALGYDAVELQFAGVNQIESPEYNSSRVTEVSASQHSYALLDIHWERTPRDPPHLVFKVVDATTARPEVVYRVNFSELERSAAAAGPEAAAGDEGPVGRRPDGTQVTPVNQFVDPAGTTIDLPGLRPQVVALSPDGRLIATSGKTSEVVIVDAATGSIASRVKPPAEAITTPATPPSDRNLEPDDTAIESYTGLVFSPDGGRLAMSNVHGSIKMFAVAGAAVTASHTLPLPPANAPERAAEIPAGLAFSPNGTRLYVCGNLSNRLLELDAKTGALLRTFAVGVAPFDVVLVGSRAFVSNLGGRRPGPGDLTGAAGKGTRVRVDAVRHTAAEGSVSVIDLETGAVREVIVGRHASALARSPDGRHVVCANSGDDSLTVLDARTGDSLATVSTKRTPAELYSAMPNGLAFDPAGTRLYVTNGARNAVAVMDWERDEPGETRLLGLIPVGWFPGAIGFDAPRGRLVVANLKGLTDRPLRQPQRVGFNSHQYHGSLSLVPLPDEGELADLSARVDRGIRATAVAAAALPPRPGVAARAIPERIGEPSLIEHVVYVIKENRTYDQVLGDLPAGRGRKDLCIFGAEITPNQHALARQFVLLDNTYCCGILSADGHNWSTAAVANDYLEKSFAGFPRSYPDGMEDADNDALAWSPAGFIWDSCLRRGKTVRNYGEFMMPRVRWRDAARKDPPGFRDCYAAWRAGPQRADVVFEAEPAVESLRPFSPRETVGWNMSVPDQFRADFVIRELEEFEKRNEFPHLVIICLPQDHTSGTDPRCPTPAACVADNDLALGRIVAALSHSRFWPKLAVFVIEDDPQDGWDHVSGYRTTAYVASPYARRGVTVSTRYNSTSILRTIGQILGLPPMNLFDASATPMSDCFVDEPDLTPFDALPANVPLDEMNPEPAALGHPLLRAHAVASGRLNFAEVDRAPEDLLNRILWHAAKGPDAAYPVWATSADRDDDEEHPDDEHPADEPASP